MGMETTIDNTSSSSKQWTLDYFTGMKIHLCVCGLFQFFLLLLRMVNFWFWLSFFVCQCFSRKFSKKTFFIKERRKKNFFLVSIYIYFQGENHSSFVRKLMCINSSFTRIFFFWLHKIKWKKKISLWKSWKEKFLGNKILNKKVNETCPIQINLFLTIFLWFSIFLSIYGYQRKKIKQTNR